MNPGRAANAPKFSILSGPTNLINALTAVSRTISSGMIPVNRATKVSAPALKTPMKSSAQVARVPRKPLGGGGGSSAATKRCISAKLMARCGPFGFRGRGGSAGRRRAWGLWGAAGRGTGRPGLTCGQRDQPANGAGSADPPTAGRGEVGDLVKLRSAVWWCGGVRDQAAVGTGRRVGREDLAGVVPAFLVRNDAACAAATATIGGAPCGGPAPAGSRAAPPARGAR